MSSNTPRAQQRTFPRATDTVRRLFTGLILMVLLLSATLQPTFSQDDGLKNDSPFNAAYRIIDVPVEDRTVTTAIWYPTREEEETHHYGTSNSSNRGMVAMNGTLAADRERYPLLFYSHGFGGSGIGYTYLTEPLARQGWIVVAPDHQDPVNAVRIRTGWQAGSAIELMNEINKLIETMQNADDIQYDYRPKDVQGVMNHVLGMDLFEERIHRNQLAIGGHSFGGFTALSVCGALGESFEPNFRAILLHAPALWMYSKEQIRQIDQPVLYMLGEQEAQRTRNNRMLRDRATMILSLLSGPGYYMELKQGRHFSFNTSQRDNVLSSHFSGSSKEFQMIRHYSTTFLSHYVSGNKKAKATLKQEVPMRSLFQMNKAAEAD